VPRANPSNDQVAAEQRQCRLDWLMSALGLLFLLVVLAEPLSRDRALSLALTITGYLLWAVFIVEFVLQLVFADDRRRFLRRNWWRIIVLAVPFLRFISVLRVLRLAALARVIGSAVRGSSSAARLLSGRLVRLSIITAVIILAASQLLCLGGAYDSYARALHDAAFTTIAGEPLTTQNGFGQAFEIPLAAYSVIVFATLAGSIGAFFSVKPRMAPVSGLTSGRSPMTQRTDPKSLPCGRGRYRYRVG
jgi:voltage-gated potassium channel